MALEHLPRPVIEPERMTGRAQSYLSVAGMRHFLIGLCCILRPEWFISVSYDQIKQLAPGGLLAWGVVGTLVGLGCFGAAAFKNVGLARGGLLASAVVTSLWAGGLFAAMLEGNLAGPTGPIIWTALTLKDLVVCRQPMRSPFEPLVREVLARRDARRGTHGRAV